LATPLEFKREGLQSGVLDKLRRGKYSQQASLSLLRQPVEQCRQMLFAFMVQAQKEGLRNVLIVHGKGRDDQSHANIIRSYLARWLEELPEVQAFCAALPHHGGSGACYVALRKSAQAKQETWEQHAKRSR
ncbi:DNA endonuclease SmrA, partial [Klebsiella pneumoniae]